MTNEEIKVLTREVSSGNWQCEVPGTDIKAINKASEREAFESAIKECLELDKGEVIQHIHATNPICENKTLLTVKVDGLEVLSSEKNRAETRGNGMPKLSGTKRSRRR